MEMSIARRQKMVRARRARGFSLIELGIVIAVIAVLAAVVIFGRGFIAAGRITKAVEAMNTIRKSASTYAGLQGGALKASTASELPTLTARSLLPVLGQNGAWTVSGTPGTPDSISITNLRFGQNGVNNAVAITVTTPNPAMAQDVINATANDNNLILNGVVVGASPACATNPGNSNTITLCFNL